MVKLLAVTVLATLAGCTGSIHVREHASLSGSPVALRAMFDGMNGLITNGKASPDQKTAHWQYREHEEREITHRAMKPGLFDGMFAPKKETIQ